jgi:hypothetical protein
MNAEIEKSNFTGRVRSLLMTSETFTDQRILAAIYTGFQTPGTQLAILTEGQEPKVVTVCGKLE